MPIRAIKRNRNNRIGKLDWRVFQCGSMLAKSECHTFSSEIPRKRLFIYCNINKRNFLVDTGSDVTIISAPKSPHRNELPNFGLQAANGTKIPVYSQRKLKFDFGTSRTFQHEVFEAATNHNILGADFIIANKLHIDLHGSRLIDPEHSRHCSGRVKRVVQVSVSTLTTTDPRIVKFLNAPIPTNIQKQVFKHTILTTKSYPIRSKPRRLNPEKLRIAKAYFQDMIRQGICRPSSSPWASPIHMVPKPNGEIRVCGDYRRLNQVTIHNSYPIRHIMDFTANLTNVTIFSKIDLKSAFYNIAMEESSIEKTAVITPFGLFEFLKMPFGLRNSAQTFQRVIDTILGNFTFCYGYIDDILIASENEETHLKHLQQVIETLRANNLTINLPKCKFFASSVEFLGHTVSAKGITPLESKITAISNAPKPTTLKSLQRFLGMLNFYRRFMPNLAQVIAPLHDLDEQFNWNKHCDKAFQDAKDLLKQHVTIAFPIDAPFYLTTDASDIASGAVLEQILNKQRRPLGFMSKKFTKTEFNYATFDKELLAIHQAIDHFRHYIEGRKVRIFTDHKPLIHAFVKPENRSPRQTRMFSFIAEFADKLEHISGKDNIVADTMSRLECETVDPFSDDKLAEAQKNEEAEIREFCEKKKLEPVFLTLNSGKRLLCISEKGKLRPFVPTSCRHTVFKLVHSLSHPSIRQTRKQIANRYYWPSMNTDISEWSRTCTDCQTSKIQTHFHVPPIPIPVPEQRFAHINIDIVGPLPRAVNGTKYLLTVVDRFSRYPEAYPLVTITAEDVAVTLWREWFTRFGIPEKVYTDQGVQFESSLFKTFCKILGTEHIKTLPYNPRANGLVERFHRTLKAAIMARNNTWYEDLPYVLLGIRTTTKEDIKASPAELVFGKNPRLPADIIPDQNSTTDTEKFLKDLRRNIKETHSTPTRVEYPTQQFIVPEHLRKATHVWLKSSNPTSLKRPYTGPFPIIKIKDRTMIIKHANGPTEVGFERIKPANLPKQVTFSLPRGRGRPRKVQD